MVIPKQLLDNCNDAWLASSDSGRAFGPCAELRWRRNADKKNFLCRWIFEGITPPPQEGECNLAQKECVTFDANPPQSYLLWGEWLDESNCWYTARIPRRLEYPTTPPSNKEDKTPLTLQVRQYQRNGQVYFERFVGLAMYKTP